MPSYIAESDPLAGTPPVYQIIDGMTRTEWSCYRYVSLKFLVTGGREDSVTCYVCEWFIAKLYCGIDPFAGTPPVLSNHRRHDVYRLGMLSLC